MLVNETCDQKTSLYLFQIDNNFKLPATSLYVSYKKYEIYVNSVTVFGKNGYQNIF